MIRQILSLCVLTGTVLSGVAQAQTAPPGAVQVLGTVRIPQAVLANGKPLPAGTYEVRLTGEQLQPLPGQTPGGERFVEFLAAGNVVGRDVAVVMTGAGGGAAAPRVEMLRGGDFLRISATRGGERYLVHLPIQRGS